MRSVTRDRVVSALARTFFLCMMLVVCSFPLSAFSTISGRIICNQELSVARREQLTDKLRAITGWYDLKFDRNGALDPGPGIARDGSQSARDLLAQARSGRNLIIVEDASNRRDVVFGQVVRGEWKNHASAMPPTFVVLIDFVDFDHLLGDKAALKAFDPGWAFLHEIDHVVNDSSDTNSELGECEDHINMMRRECNLPFRTDYYFTYFPSTHQSDFQTRFVRLAFEQEDRAGTKRRRYWVVWDATLVGDLPSPEIARRK